MVDNDPKPLTPSQIRYRKRLERERYEFEESLRERYYDAQYARKQALESLRASDKEIVAALKTLSDEGVSIDSQEQVKETFIVQIDLGDVSPEVADDWLTFITETVSAHEPGFSGLVSMRKEIVDG